MDIFEVVSQPDNKKVIGSKWVYYKKYGPNGKIQKYKAHVITQGFTQVEGIDFDKTFSLVANPFLLYTILALAAKLNLKVYQIDVKLAYLNGKLEEEVYIDPPPGFGILEGTVAPLDTFQLR